MIDKDDFDAWRDNPVTQAVFKALGKVQARAKEHWMAASWDSGDLRPELLADLRARHQAIEDLTDMTLERMEAELADE